MKFCLYPLVSLLSPSWHSIDPYTICIFNISFKFKLPFNAFGKWEINKIGKGSNFILRSRAQNTLATPLLSSLSPHCPVYSPSLPSICMNLEAVLHSAPPIDVWALDNGANKCVMIKKLVDCLKKSFGHHAHTSSNKSNTLPFPQK